MKMDKAVFVSGLVLFKFIGGFAFLKLLDVYLVSPGLIKATSFFCNLLYRQKS